MGLREIRQKKGFFQKAIAKELGISRQTYYVYENDITKMSIGHLIKACKYMKCDWRELLDQAFIEHEHRSKDNV